jgi:hypothetical protein
MLTEEKYVCVRHSKKVAWQLPGVCTSNPKNAHKAQKRRLKKRDLGGLLRIYVVNDTASPQRLHLAFDR